MIRGRKTILIPRALCALSLLAVVAVSGCAIKNEPAAVPASAAPPVTSTSAVLELTVLGSGGPGAVGRASSCFVLSLDGTPRVLIDAGSGAFARLGEANLSLDHLDLILLTHLHIDHSAELPGIFKARAVSMSGAIRFQVFGPTGSRQFPSTRRFVDLLFGKQGAFAYLADFSAPITIAVTDVDATLQPGAQPQTLLEENGLKITAIPGHHDDAPAVIYRVDYRGRSIVFSGDIDPAGLANLRLIANGCDLLVFNTVVLDPPASPRQLYSLHSPPKSIGELAGAAHAGALLLAHLNPAIDEAHDAVLASIGRGYTGPVSFAEDRMRLSVGK